MTQNPYSAPEAANSERRGSLVCVIGFWLSVGLSLCMLGIAANGGYQYWFYQSQGIPVPTSILAESMCVAFCAVGMLCSAVAWRRSMVRIAVVCFVCCLLAFLGGPSLIRFLMN